MTIEIKKSLLPEPYNSKVTIINRQVQNIGREKNFFVPRTLEETEKLLMEVKPLHARLRDLLDPFRIEGYTLSQAWIFARDLALELAQKYQREEMLRTAWQKTHEVSMPFLQRAASSAVSGDRTTSQETIKAHNDMVKNTGVVLSRIAAWEVISDLPELAGIENPDKILLEYYKKGLLFVDFRSFDHIQVPVAHQIVIDSKEPNKRYLVCLPENHGTVKLRHKLADNCNGAILISA